MKVMIFGATGMVGQGVVLECLAHSDVESVLAVGRSSSGINHPKLREVVQKDLFDYSAIKSELAGWDACFFCLGVSSVGMSEPDYHRVTFELTLAAARVLAELNPGMTFCYVSGAGTDSTERGRSMWARVKGKTENALLGLGFRAAFMFRPGYIQPMKGVRSRTTLYRLLYAVFRPLFWAWRFLFPGLATTTERMGLAMIHVVTRGYSKPLLEVRDINALAG
jgi:uncharacterized protein YbjT (DUF2867 family)